MAFPVGAGEVISATDINFLNQAPSGQISIGSSKLISNAVVTTLNFDVTDWASGVTADLVADRLIVITPGIYVVTVFSEWALNSTGQRYLAVRKNGVDSFRDRRPSLDFGEASPSGHISLIAGDYIELQVYQTSGASLNLNKCRMGLTYQRKLP